MMPKFSVGDKVKVCWLAEPEWEISSIPELLHNQLQMYRVKSPNHVNARVVAEPDMKLLSRKGEAAKSLCNKCKALPCVCETDNVNHPQHYTSHPSGVECIQITEHMGFNLGNALKYIWRADLKADAIEDMEKAVWYLQRELAKRGAAK